MFTVGARSSGRPLRGPFGVGAVFCPVGMGFRARLTRSPAPTTCGAPRWIWKSPAKPSTRRRHDSLRAAGSETLARDLPLARCAEAPGAPQGGPALARQGLRECGGIRDREAELLTWPVGRLQLDAIDVVAVRARVPRRAAIVVVAGLLAVEEPGRIRQHFVKLKALTVRVLND